MAARFAKTDLRVDVSHLDAGDRKALAKLVQAARTYDFIYMDQLWSGNRALYEQLKRDTSPLGKARLILLDQQGPWSDLDGHGPSCPACRRRNCPARTSIRRT